MQSIFVVTQFEPQQSLPKKKFIKKIDAKKDGKKEKKDQKREQKSSLFEKKGKMKNEFIIPENTYTFYYI